MAVLAYYQLSYEAGNRENQPVDIEKTLNVQLLKRNAAGVAQAYGREYVRKSDVVLAGEGSGNETIVEVKSFKRPVVAGRYTQWDLSTGKALVDEAGNSKSIHKQFFLDRVAMTGRGNSFPKLVGDMRWWFHYFNRGSNSRGIEGYRDQDVREAVKKLLVLPKGRNQKVGRHSLGVSSGNPTVGLAAKVNSFRLKSVLLQEFKDRLFEGIDDELFNELVVNSSHDLP